MSDLKSIAKEHAGKGLNVENKEKFSEYLSEKKDNLFAFEKEAKKFIDNQYLLSKYRPISLDFLSMRDDEGYPKFSIFTLNNTECFFGYRTRESVRLNHICMLDAKDHMDIWHPISLRF